MPSVSPEPLEGQSPVPGRTSESRVLKGDVHSEKPFDIQLGMSVRERSMNVQNQKRGPDQRC